MNEKARVKNGSARILTSVELLSNVSYHPKKNKTI